jgi:hypothetical protein
MVVSSMIKAHALQIDIAGCHMGPCGTPVGPTRHEATSPSSCAKHGTCAFNSLG